MSAQHEKAFKELLVIDQLRGDHSTGMAIIPRNNVHPRVVKTVGGPENLSALKAYDKAFEGVQRACIGHNRYATVGAITNATAHPFTMEHITGVHNGTLRMYSELEGYRDYSVDSQVLYHHIAALGLVDAVSKTSGAIALMYWDRTDETVVLYRNSERPLFLVYTEDNKVVFVASELWMLYGILDRNKIKYHPGLEVPENHSMTFHIPSNTHMDLAKPHLRKIEPRVVTTYPVANGGNYAGWYNRSEVTSKNSHVVNVEKPDVSDVKTNKVTDLAVEYPLLRATNLILKMEYYGTIRERSWVIFTCAAHLGDLFVADPAKVARMGLIEGDEVISDCNGMVMDKNQEHFYVMKTESITNMPVSQDTGGSYRGANNEDLTLKEWERKYGTCANCTGDVDVGTHRFDTNGNVFCVECHSNKALSEIIKV